MNSWTYYKHFSAYGLATDARQIRNTLLLKLLKKHVPEDQQEQFTSLLSEYCEKLERQAFDVGFKTAVQLWQQLDNTEEIYGGITK